MAGLSFKQIEDYWIQAGGDPSVANIAAAITGAEASFNPNAIQQGQPYSTTGWGLWQITPGNSVPSVGIDNALLDPLTNAKAAVAKYNAAGGFSPWVTYVNGAYKAFLNSSGGTNEDKSAPPTNTPTHTTGSATLVDVSTAGFWSTLGKDFNPFYWGGQLDKALGIPTLKNPVTETGKALSGFLAVANKSYELFLHLFQPSFWFRVGAFIVGILAFGGGMFLLASAHGSNGGGGGGAGTAAKFIK